jgi:beta-glucosidase
MTGKRTRRPFTAAFFAGAVVCVADAASAQPVVATPQGSVAVSPVPPPAELPWLDKSLSPAARAQMLVRAMTLEEKIAVLSGSGRKNENGQIWQAYVKGNPRLGIPDMTQGDAPNGIMIGSDAVTQMPNGTALAATFSRVDARAYGGALGAETRALGYGVLHGPNLDVNRDPRHGRTHETFGEDPFLAGQIAAEYVKGVQANRVIADAKHYAVNTVEKGRMGLDAQVDRRTLHELYLAPFQVAVQEGKLGMIMCAYNKINGVQACDRADMLNGLLREKWGFDGVVRTDFRAAHALEAIVVGLDQEFANTLGWGDRLLAAARAGTIPESAVETAVERVMRTMIAYGIFDDPPKRVGADLAASAKVAERVAADSVVMLRNERALLPLDPNRTKRIAVIGAAADDRALAGGPGAPAPTGKVTILEGIKARVPRAAIEFQSGIDPLYSISKENGYPQIPSGALTAHDGSHGASATYYAADGKPLVTRTDICVCYTPNTFFETNVSQRIRRRGPPASPG